MYGFGISEHSGTLFDERTNTKSTQTITPQLSSIRTAALLSIPSLLILQYRSLFQFEWFLVNLPLNQGTCTQVLTDGTRPHSPPTNYYRIPHISTRAPSIAAAEHLVHLSSHPMSRLPASEDLAQPALTQPQPNSNLTPNAHPASNWRCPTT